MTLKCNTNYKEALPEWEKESHMLGPLPSSFAAPSTFHIYKHFFQGYKEIERILIIY